MIYNKLNEKFLSNDNIIKNNDIEILCHIMLPTKDIYVVDEEFSKNPIAIETDYEETAIVFDVLSMECTLILSDLTFLDERYICDILFKDLDFARNKKIKLPLSNVQKNVLKKLSHHFRNFF